MAGLRRAGQNPAVSFLHVAKDPIADPKPDWLPQGWTRRGGRLPHHGPRLAHKSTAPTAAHQYARRQKLGDRLADRGARNPVGIGQFTLRRDAPSRLQRTALDIL